jgi:hypothetical protein
VVPAATLGIDLKIASGIWPVCLTFLPALALAELHVVIIEGLEGESRYGEQFREQVAAIDVAARTLTDNDRIRVFRSNDASRDNVLGYFESLSSILAEDDQLAVFLIGHGSFDDHEYKFNIPGPDLTGEDLLNILNNMPNSNQLLVNTSSASGATADMLQQEERMLILATRSGVERHATRFGVYFASGLSDPAADVDKNRIITALEAFNYAERQVEDFYVRRGSLATEHPRMEGDQMDRFSLARLGLAPTVSGDERLGDLVADRNALNARIDELRLSRERMSADDYQARFLELMLDLARVEEAIEERERKVDLDE